MLVKILVKNCELRERKDEEIISCLLERDFYMLLQVDDNDDEDVCGYGWEENNCKYVYLCMIIMRG